jgi:SAM-dependent methyltransferase
MSLEAVLIGAAIVLLGVALVYYLLVRTEGVYLGRRVVVWLYDVYAGRYDRIKNYDATYETWFLARPMLDRLADIPAPLILDVGTGTGRVPIALLDQDDFQGRVVGLDLSRQMLFHAALKLCRDHRRCDLVWHTVEALPFPDETFDLVASIEALEFFPQPLDNLRELVRVLRSGGVLVISNRKGLDARLMPGKTLSTAALVAYLGDELGMSDVEDERWQVDYDLIWARKAGFSRSTGARPLVEVLRCPSCGAVDMIPTEGDPWVCGACERRYPVGDDGVLELFRSR